MTAFDRVERALAAAHAAQAPLNVFTHLDDEAAMDRAAGLDGADDEGMPAGGLAGVPVGIKDLIDHEGRITTAGSAFYRHEAERSSPVVSRLEDAGAVVIGRTGLHEFAFGFSSENPHFGPVRNPWDPGTSPGGSSGGSAAAVAAGITPIAIGTDTGGSVRPRRPVRLLRAQGDPRSHPTRRRVPAGRLRRHRRSSRLVDRWPRPSYRALSGDQSEGHVRAFVSACRSPGSGGPDGR